MCRSPMPIPGRPPARPGTGCWSAAPLLEDPNHPKVGQNLKYDMSVLARHGVGCAASPTTPCSSPTCWTAPPPATTWTRSPRTSGHDTIHFEDVAGKGAKQLTFDQVPWSPPVPYAAEDADVTLRLHQVLWPRLRGDRPSLAGSTGRSSCPWCRSSRAWSAPGCASTRTCSLPRATTWPSASTPWSSRPTPWPGGRFNMGSPKQIGEIFFEELGLPVVAKTPKGPPPPRRRCWSSSPSRAQLPRIILEHRGLSKLKSTYTDKLPPDGQPGHRPGAHLLPPGGGRHRAAVLLRPQPAEHPHAHRGRAPHPPRLRRRGGAAHPGGGLLPDRAAHHGPPVRRRAPARRLRRGLDIHRATAAEVWASRRIR
jgi:DNA polymerase I